MDVHEAIITVEGLGHRYRTVRALREVSFSVGPGEIFGILGRNGAGKSTVIRVIAGLLSASEGSIAVAGLHPRKNRAALRQVLGVQLQDAELHAALTVGEIVALYRSFYRRGKSASEVIRAVGLEDSTSTRFENLSGGQQQRLSIALAMLGDPRILLLDELTTGLDPDGRRAIWALVESVRDEGVTVVLVSHHMDEVERLCDRVLVLHEGTVLAEGSPADFVRQLGDFVRLSFASDDLASLEDLRSIDGVRDVAVRHDRFELEVAADSLQSVERALESLEIAIHQRRVVYPNLEDAFLALLAAAAPESAAHQEQESAA
ncbi:ABC transporter ATP-binding protein [Humidisolicoccus flavus]|uniref:ABC transporter ATP-binding protein n=1 Tax=Humidisolicoccus flavus TaxID=3111414 RepID=UPI003254ABA3